MRKLKSPLSLVILGLLAEQPLHPYAIRTLMRERGHDRGVRAAGASLYDAVARLETAGLIQAGHASRDGRRPERTTYEITNNGRRELQSWVRTGLSQLGTPEGFQAALSFMYALGKDQTVAALEHRLATLTQLIGHADRELDHVAETVPAIFLSEERYAQHLRVCEQQWLEDFIDQLRTGRLTWPQREKHG